AVASGGSSAPVLTPVVVNFSTALSVAVAMLDGGELLASSLDEERLARDQDVILRHARRVEVVHDAERTGALLRECDRVLDLAALLEGVSIRHLGRGVSGATRDMLEVARGLGGTGRAFVARLLGHRARGTFDRVTSSV